MKWNGWFYAKIIFWQTILNLSLCPSFSWYSNYYHALAHMLQLNNCMECMGSMSREYEDKWKTTINQCQLWRSLWTLKMNFSQLPIMLDGGCQNYFFFITIFLLMVFLFIPLFKGFRYCLVIKILQVLIKSRGVVSWHEVFYENWEKYLFWRLTFWQ